MVYLEGTIVAHRGTGEFDVQVELPPTEQCRTVSSSDYPASSWGQPCAFPLTHDGAQHTSCTKVQAPKDTNGNVAIAKDVNGNTMTSWCAVNTTAWGWCAPSCFPAVKTYSLLSHQIFVYSGPADLASIEFNRTTIFARVDVLAKRPVNHKF